VCGCLVAGTHQIKQVADQKLSLPASLQLFGGVFQIKQVADQKLSLLPCF
jgi:hypothetical protein